jgi:hypothetical protein
MICLQTAIENPKLHLHGTTHTGQTIRFIFHTHTVPNTGTIQMKRKHQKTLDAIYARPVSANIQWRDIEALFVELGAEISEREDSRIAVVLFDELRVFHRPHPSPDTDKGAVASIRKWFEQHGVAP